MKQNAISRYQTAFENGTMDDTTAGPRLRELQQATLLRARLAELHDAASQPQPPEPETLARLAST